MYRPFFGAPGMARSALTGAVPVTVVVTLDDLAVRVRYRPDKGNG